MHCEIEAQNVVTSYGKLEMQANEQVYRRYEKLIYKINIIQ
jgi:hypothetical protein